MTINRNHFIAPSQRQALITLTAISYIEEHGLLKPDQLADAKKSLQALFIRASGEETMLRKLIEVLKTSRRLQNSFTSISNILTGVGKSITIVEGKLGALRTRIEQMNISAEAHTDFIGSFLSLSQQFIQKGMTFSESLSQYLAAREEEARTQSLYQIAIDARERLRQRLSGNLGQASNESEERIKDEIVSSFDYGEAGTALQVAKQTAKSKEQDVQEQLRDIQSICWLAMNPALRDPLIKINPESDIFARFTAALPRHPSLTELKEAILELFKLYQHSHGMFQLDYQKLNRAFDMMMTNAEAYFQAKEEDRDVTIKREKLQKIEGLIPFLEQAAHLATADSMDAYLTFSRQLSATISERRTPWNHIAEDLLRAKVQAEAEISTRL